MADEFVFPVRSIHPVSYLAPIAQGQSLSGIVTLGSVRPAAVVIPPDVDGAQLSFMASYDGLLFYSVRQSSEELIVECVPSSIVVLPLVDLLWAVYLKIRTGTATAPVVQSADVNLIVIGA